MAVLNPADLTFNGDEIKALNEAVFELVFEKPELSLFHNIIGGIKAKTQIAILGRINGLTGLGDGGCDPADDTNTISMSEKFWNPETISNSLPTCWTDLKATFFIYGTNNGIAKADLTKTDYFNFLLERYADTLVEEVFRNIWFTDVDAATTADSPAGNITAGTNLGYFNRINGLWKQAFAIVAATPARLTAGFGPRNGQATVALQQFTQADTDNRVATNTLQDMRFGSDFRLRGIAERMIVVTQSVADQYERELIANRTVYESEALENGITILKIGSVMIVGFQFWDRIIAEFFSNGAASFLPHRALMLTKLNTQVATEEEGNFSEFEVFYHQKSKKNYVRTQYDIDAKIVQDELIQGAW